MEPRPDVGLPSLEGSSNRRKFPEVRWHWLIVPPVIFFLLSYVFSLYVFISNSLHPFLGIAQIGDEWTLINYMSVLTDPYYLSAFQKTLLMSLESTAIALILGYPLAYFIIRSTYRWKMLLLVAVVASSYTGVVVRTLGWTILFAEGGPFNRLFLNLGLIDEPLKLTGSMIGPTIGLAHVYMPQMVLFLMASIQNVNPNLEKAALGLGATSWTTFWRVTFPLTLPGVLAGSILVFALCNGTFTTPSLLGGGRLGTIPILVGLEVMTNINYPIGATLSFLLLTLVLILIYSATVLGRRRAF